MNKNFGCFPTCEVCGRAFCLKILDTGRILTCSNEPHTKYWLDEIQENLTEFMEVLRSDWDFTPEQINIELLSVSIYDLEPLL